MAPLAQLREIIAHSLKNIFAAAGRSFFTISGIALGAAATVFLYSLNLSFTGHTVANLGKLGGNIIVVNLSPNSSYSPEAVKRSFQPFNSLISSVAFFTEANYFLNEAGLNINLLVRGIDRSFIKLKNWKISGNFMDFSDQCLVSRKLTDNSRGFYRAGQKIRLADCFFQIAGIAPSEPENFFDAKPVIYLPRESLNKMAFQKTECFYIKAKNLKDVFALESRLKKIWPEESGISIFSLAAARAVIFEFSRLAGSLIFLVTLLTVLVGGLGVANVMLINLAEKTYEYGILLALGISPRMIFAEVLSESVCLSLIGGCFGAVTGFFLQLMAAAFLGWELIFPIGVVFLVLAASLFFGLIFGFYPAGRAARLAPIEAIRGIG